MDVVWSVTALYPGPLGLWAYHKVGWLSTKESARRAQEAGEEPPGKRKPFWQMVGVSATPCGAGYTLAVIIHRGGSRSVVCRSRREVTGHLKRGRGGVRCLPRKGHEARDRARRIAWTSSSGASAGGGASSGAASAACSS